jgi:hypothetical protein
MSTNETPTHTTSTAQNASNEEANGQCLCGAVSFTCSSPSPGVDACHCSTCQGWGGGPLLAVDCGSDIAFQGADHISIYASSQWAERAFCQDCGSHLFYRLKHDGKHIVPVGLFRDGPAFHLDHQIFIDEKPDYFSFANVTHNMTGAEVFAQVQSEQP